MSHCEKIRTDVVICDEIFYFNDLEIDVPWDLTHRPTARWQVLSVLHWQNAK